MLIGRSLRAPQSDRWVTKGPVPRPAPQTFIHPRIFTTRPSHSIRRWSTSMTEWTPATGAG